MDSLVLGCIPVLFHQGQTKQWPWHWGSWQANSSVYFDMEEISKRRIDPIAELVAIPPWRIAQMQATISRHAHAMQYAFSDATALMAASPFAGLQDAFDVALSYAWAHSTDASAVEAGLRTQQGDGAALDAALDLFDREPAVGSWGGRSTGTCMRSWAGAGDCTHGDAGTWHLGSAEGVLSLDDCTARCRRCDRCNWISLSHAHGQCDWHHTCNTSKLNRRFGGDTFKTRFVHREHLD